ncbi:histone H3.v1-like [Cucurbita moschata]|uniref:Histone H3.v1-like n=1 Tax=Cucurbita moschata TaxID=3662 RepID=A0A6J1FKQ3_CUCMO|nr:histone H3.v1-like [Cucurbita moschata]
MMKCELCGQLARTFCESDRANLCWDCDEKVHCANFLVAKHSRSLLCRACQSPTPWTASGRKLTPTVSVCEGCVEVHCGKWEQGGFQERRRDNEVEVNGGDDFDDGEGFGSYEGGDSEDADEDDDEEEEEEEEAEEDEDGENQVVPWSCASSSTPPPPPTVTSSSEGEMSACAGGVSKRRREYDVDLDSDDEFECSSAQQGTRPSYNDEATSSTSHRPPKQARVTGPTQSASIIPDDEARKADLKSTAVIRSIQSLQNRLPTGINDASKLIFGICKISRDQNR